MSVEKAKKYLEKFGKSDDVIEFAVSSATVELAARALGCEPGAHSEIHIALLFRRKRYDCRRRRR